jgi:hypothetical protein
MPSRQQLCTKPTPDNIPNDRRSEKDLASWTSQETRLGRLANILDIGKDPLLCSYSDENNKNSRDQLRYREPVSHNALNVEAPTHTQKRRTRWNLDIMPRLEALQK